MTQTVEERKAVDRARATRWRLANPDKRKAQLERWKARVKLGLTTDNSRKTIDEIIETRRVRMQRYNERRKERLASDPAYRAEYNAKKAAQQRAAYARKNAKQVPGATYITKAERSRIAAEKREARQATLLAKSEAKAIQQALKAQEKASRIETAEQERIRKAREAERRRKRREAAAAKRLAERIQKSVEIEAAKQLQAEKRAAEKKPVICPDPPELVALFKKASKGLPPQGVPIGVKVRKKSVFSLRGY